MARDMFRMSSGFPIFIGKGGPPLEIFSHSTGAPPQERDSTMSSREMARDSLAPSMLGVMLRGSTYISSIIVRRRAVFDMMPLLENDELRYVVTLSLSDKVIMSTITPARDLGEELDMHGFFDFINAHIVEEVRS